MKHLFYNRFITWLGSSCVIAVKAHSKCAKACDTEDKMSKQHWIKIALAGGITAISLALAQTGGFDPKKVTEILEMTGPDSEVMDMAFSPDGKRLAVASDVGTGRLWDTEQGRIAVQLTGHQNAISGLSYTTDGKSLVTMGNDDLLKTWDATSGKETSSVNLKCNRGGNGDIVALKDNRAVVTCAGLKIVDLKGGKILSTFKGPGSVYKLAVSPDQRTVLGSIGYSEFQLWDMQSLESFRQLKGHESQGFAVSYSANGKLLATGASDKVVKVWNAATGKLLFTLKGHDNGIEDVAFSPDSKLLATASGDRTIKLWDTATGEEISTLEGHKEGITQLAWSKDGKMLASGDEGGIIKLWGNP
jgi:WD40 repeat protein